MRGWAQFSLVSTLSPYLANPSAEYSTMNELRQDRKKDDIKMICNELLSLFPCSSVSKESACSSGDLGSIPGLGRSPGEGNGNPLQYPCLENLMERGAYRAAVHGVAKSRAWLSD